MSPTPSNNPPARFSVPLIGLSFKGMNVNDIPSSSQNYHKKNRNVNTNDGKKKYYPKSSTKRKFYKKNTNTSTPQKKTDTKRNVPKQVEEENTILQPKEVNITVKPKSNSFPKPWVTVAKAPQPPKPVKTSTSEPELVTVTQTVIESIPEVVATIEVKQQVEELKETSPRRQCKGVILPESFSDEDISFQFGSLGLSEEEIEKEEKIDDIDIQLSNDFNPLTKKDSLIVESSNQVELLPEKEISNPLDIFVSNENTHTSSSNVHYQGNWNQPTYYGQEYYPNAYHQNYDYGYSPYGYYQSYQPHNYPYGQQNYPTQYYSYDSYYAQYPHGQW